MTVAAAAPAVPVNPAALAQRVTQLLRAHKGPGVPVILVAGAPTWPHDPILTTRDGAQVRVVPASSVLAVWEQVVAEHDLPCVVLTSLPEEDLGTGLLSRVLRRRVNTMNPWALIAESFGAQHVDPRLEKLRWAGPALISAIPKDGWPPLAGTILQHDVALAHLTVERLGLDRIGIGAGGVDAPALLRWSMLPTAEDDLDRLGDAERDGLLSWLTEACGPAGQMVRHLQAAGHVRDALPLGVVCAALWNADRPDARAQGRIEQYAGGAQLDAATVRGYGAAATETAVELMRTDWPVARAVLDRAEDLLTMFAARDAARHSTTLPVGFDSCLNAAATALQEALDHTGDPSSAIATAEAAARNLAAHALARPHRHRVERAEMAVRLLRWLATTDIAVEGVAQAIDRQVTDWSWVDVALGHVWTGEDAHAALSGAYRAVHDRARKRRHELDAAFASRLAVWAARPDDTWTVESVLKQVVAPVVQQGTRGVLLVVLDGMSAAVANELTADLTESGWLEYDPTDGRAAAHRTARRRGIVSGLPSVTAVSRTSLLTASLRRGTKSDERAAFEKHAMWQGRKARLFHKDTVLGGAGEVLNEELITALGEPETLVGVVINTVDDALDHGREGADAGWRIGQIGPLRTLLDHASYHGRAVIITSDHGHVLERGGSIVPAGTAASARHRTDAAPPADGEVELAGPRVLDGDHRVVALWDEGLRYLPRRAGYHGGASMAEVTVPVVALLPIGATAPAGWRALGPQQPPWWNPATPAATVPTPPPPAPERPRKASRRPAGQDSALFDLAPIAPAEPAPAPASVVEQVLDSEMFKAQHSLTPRKVPIAKVRGALTALIDANGTLPSVLVAQQAGESAARAGGFLTTLQRIFNVDNYPVLTVLDDGRTARIDVELMRQQFGVGGPA